MKNMGLILFSVILFLASCSHDPVPVPADPLAVKYMTTTAGSKWNYEAIDNVSLTTSLYSLTSTSRDSTIGGKQFHVYLNSSTNASEYYNITGGDYYSYQSLPAALGGTKAENLYLKSNAAINFTWSQSYPVTISGVPITVNVTNKIIEKSISKTVNGTTYTQVIHVETTLAIPGIPSTSLTTDIQSYYAPKVGLIENNTKINLNYLTIVNNTNSQTKLKTTNIP
ncbi:MAG: hypothetical protein ABIT07_13295 [Ferruginibacter sp.]